QSRPGARRSEIRRVGPQGRSAAVTLARPHHVVVCGGGMSGLTAAATALEKGAAVTILEKGHAVGGSAVLSSGHIWTHASVETAAELIPDGNAAIQERIISTVQD